MTNIYNGLIDNLERSLGLKRHDTERALMEMNEPLSPDALLRQLFGKQERVADWHRDIADSGPEGKVDNATSGSLGDAQEITMKLVSPIFSRDNRSNSYTRVGGNLLAGLMDLWVQQEPFKDKPLRSAHIVEYDMINMEAVKLATEKMVQAVDEANKQRPSKMKTNTQRFTDGYMRIVNGLVREAFVDEMHKAGIQETDNRLYPVRLSNGDEFRMIVVGLDNDQVAHATQVAQDKVQKMVSEMGFDALPHLKHLADDKKWASINTLKALSEDEIIYKAFKYGGAGIKIGSVELGDGLDTAKVEHLLDLELHSCREKRADARQKAIDGALIKLNGHPIPQIFNKAHPHSNTELGTIELDKPKNFKVLMEVTKDARYRDYYRRPEVEARDFPYDIHKERENALPANNPDAYAREFVQLITQYVGLPEAVCKTMEIYFLHSFPKAVDGDTRPRSKQVAAAVMAQLTQALDAPPSPGDARTVLIARTQLAEKRDTLTEKLETFCDSVNPYESFDLTRKRILEREGDKLYLSEEQRLIYFHQPLQIVNARHSDGYCMNGRVKEAVKVFQGAGKEERMYCYIGLSSFSGTNEVSTALGRSINDNIRRITAEELRKRFGEKSLDFAFNVESGRMNLLTHGISKDELVDTLGTIEKRVDTEINQQSLNNLLRRYQIFTRQSDEIVLHPHTETDADIRHIHDDVQRAQELHGHDTPLAFRHMQEGEVRARTLAPEELITHGAALASGHTVFLEQRSREMLLTPPKHVEEYLKRSGYVDSTGGLDLGKPLALLPNTKHSHEKGVRVITAYVTLQGNSPQLAEQRKGELYRLVEYKKRKAYAPGTGNEVQIPVESNPHYAHALSPTIPATSNGMGGNGLQIGPHGMVTHHGLQTTHHRNVPSGTTRPVKIDRSAGRNGKPKDLEGWLRMLDQREFEMWQQRQVPETLLQVIGYPHIKVEPDHNTFVIHIERQNQGYDREDVEVPGRRALFIKHALEDHFGAAAVVTGINPSDTGGNRDKILRVRCQSIEGRGTFDRKTLPAKEAELLKFFEDLSAIKERQAAGGNGVHNQPITQSLQQQVDKYRYQLKAIHLMRQFPTIKIEPSRHTGGDFVITIPQEPQERKSTWKQRNDDLLGALKTLLSEKAFECEEEDDMPAAGRNGGGSTKARIKYVIRIESTPVSHDVLTYMGSLQQTHTMLGEGAARW